MPFSNMDGGAIFEAVAAIYISQSLDHEMTLGKVILVRLAVVYQTQPNINALFFSLTATLASIGAAGIPQAGLVTMIMVLIAIGVDPSYFALIVPVDWLL